MDKSYLDIIIYQSTFFTFKSALELRLLADGSLIRDLPLDVGSVLGYSGRKEQDEMFYLFASFLTPGIIYRYDFTKANPQPEVSD